MTQNQPPILIHRGAKLLTSIILILEVSNEHHCKLDKIRILLRLNPPHQDEGAYLSWSDLGGVNFIRGCKFYKLTLFYKLKVLTFYKLTLFYKLKVLTFYKLTLFYKLKVLTFKDYKLRSNTNIIASILTYIT